jgi:type IV secretion system protein TrbL
MFKKLLYMGFWIWMVRNFPSLAHSFMDSLVHAGQLAGGGGGGVSLLMDPSAIAGYGLDATNPLAKKILDFHITEIGDTIVYVMAYLGILVCFFLMAIHVFMGVLEYYLIVAIVGILMPFGLLQSTKFLAEKAIGAVVAASVKLMVLSFLLAAIEPVLRSSLKFSSPDVPLNELFAMFLTVCALMLLVWKAPHLASSLLAGSPSLGAGDAVAPLAAAAAVAVMKTKEHAKEHERQMAQMRAAGGAGGADDSSRSATGAGASLSSASKPLQSLGSVGARSGASAAASGAGAGGASSSASAAAPSAASANRTLVMSSMRPPEQLSPAPRLVATPA